jgi:hypothetical protein
LNKKFLKVGSGTFGCTADRTILDQWIYRTVKMMMKMTRIDRTLIDRMLLLPARNLVDQTSLGNTSRFSN